MPARLTITASSARRSGQRQRRHSVADPVAVRQEGAGRLAGRALQLDVDGVVRQAGVAVTLGHFARQHGADRAVDVAHRRDERHALAFFQRAQHILEGQGHGLGVHELDHFQVHLGLLHADARARQVLEAAHAERVMTAGERWGDGRKVGFAAHVSDARLSRGQDYIELGREHNMVLKQALAAARGS